MSRITPLLTRTLHQMKIATQRQTSHGRTQEDRQRERIYERLRPRCEDVELFRDADVGRLAWDCGRMLESRTRPDGEVCKCEVDACDVC